MESPVRPFKPDGSELFVVIVVWLAVGGVQAEPENIDAAATLRSQYQALGERLKNNQFHKPLYLDSQETADNVAGDIHALIDHPFSRVAATLTKAENWCDILILHPNTKYCRAAPAEPTTASRYMSAASTTSRSRRPRR